MKLSIIIPYYNAEPYTTELLNCLAPQIVDGVEVVLVDDGSYTPFSTNLKWVRVFRQPNGGVSKARNVGIEKAKGEYISFIDADDLVSPNYVRDILDKAKQGFDILEMSWKSLKGGLQCGCKLSSENDRLHNPSVCTRAFNKAFIGDLRFNEIKDSAEDEEFTRKLMYKNGNIAVITDYSYFYRTAVVDSKTKKYMAGELNTKRICYYYDHITADMQYLLEDVREEDKYNEVIILTNRCDIPELRKYAQVIHPQVTRGHELRGEPCSFLRRIEIPIKTQVVIWTKKMPEMGGVYTFVYDFCVMMKDYYDIVVLCDEIKQTQVDKLAEHVQVVANTPNTKVQCEVLIMNRIKDAVPTGVTYKKIFQMCHTCFIDPTFQIPKDRDRVIYVSDTSKKSFNDTSSRNPVIHNLVPKTGGKRALILVSATRLDTFEKGKNRMKALANLMTSRGIPYVWLCFSNVKMLDMPDNFVWMPTTLDILPYIRMADYLVQLSDSESFCYSLVEALQCGVPVLTTKLDVLSEIGFQEGVNGYTIPFDIQDDFDIEKIYRKPAFKYDYDNNKEIQKWCSVLGNMKPTHSYRAKKKVMVKVRTLIKYHDKALNVLLMPNVEMMMERDRAYYLANVKKFVEIIPEK